MGKSMLRPWQGLKAGEGSGEVGGGEEGGGMGRGRWQRGGGDGEGSNRDWKRVAMGRGDVRRIWRGGQWG